MQRVEIIRALLTNPQLLILDEPTSVLTPQAVEKLFVVLRQLASEGCSILYISHKLHEIRELCTACTVLRGGKVTGVCDPRRRATPPVAPDDRRRAAALEHRAAQPAPRCWRCKGLSLPRADQFGVDLIDIGLEVRAGEVVGIAGVSGNGQQELLYALSGEDRAPPARSRSGVRPDARRMRPGQRRAGPALRARGAPGPRRRAHAGPGAQPAAHAHEAVGAGGWIRLGACKSAGAGHHRALQRQGRRPGGGGQVAVGRQPAESSSSAARSTPTPSC
jgi:simple sugar transport system ATP-binding protein